MIKFPLEQSQIALSIEHNIDMNFSSLKEVEAIYVQDFDTAYQVFVFLKQEHYDEELMDCLLDKESNILDLHQDKLFRFHYLPLFDHEPSQSAPKNAVKIFSR